MVFWAISWKIIVIFLTPVPKYLVAKLILTYVARFWRNNHPREIIDIFAGMGKISPSNEEWNIVKENNFFAVVAGVVPHLCGGSLELHQIYDSPVTPSPSAQFSLPQVFFYYYNVISQKILFPKNNCLQCYNADFRIIH